MLDGKSPYNRVTSLKGILRNTSGWDDGNEMRQNLLCHSEVPMKVNDSMENNKRYQDYSRSPMNNTPSALEPRGTARCI